MPEKKQEAKKPDQSLLASNTGSAEQDQPSETPSFKEFAHSIPDLPTETVASHGEGIRVKPLDPEKGKILLKILSSTADVVGIATYLMSLFSGNNIVAAPPNTCILPARAQASVAGLPVQTSQVAGQHAQVAWELAFSGVVHLDTTSHCYVVLGEKDKSLKLTYPLFEGTRLSVWLNDQWVPGHVVKFASSEDYHFEAEKGGVIPLGEGMVVRVSNTSITDFKGYDVFHPL